jgi:putative transposase
MFHQRRLPHYYPPDAVLFVTLRLFGSLPGQDGSRWLEDPRIASIVAAAIEQGEAEYGLYERFAWVIMPNHVHLVIRPFRPLSAVNRWIKGSTARAANLVLGRTGKPFWHYESYDHCIRDTAELNRIIQYVEQNPVRAGLVDWP